ncbi:hypothetical protein F5887DRAFT_296296 [Amanita rubescens]|nr:hypothetical protein F5887DRAFT_296296 [Amanita rubescens]
MVLTLLIHAPSNHPRALRNTMAPSPEILSEIFTFTLPTNRELYSMPQFYDSERRKLIITTPVFCAVCSSWRSLALATPRLWNRILIHIPRRINKAQVNRKAADLIQWISRSHSLPLTLHVSGDIVTPPNGKGPEAPIILVIKDHAARWESLYFRVSQPSSFLLHFDGWHSLRRLYYPYLDPVSCANETVPWAHLTHLQIRKFIPCPDAAMIFTKCPKLVYFSILVNPDPSTIGQSTVPIILEDLVTFYLKAYNAASLQTVLHQVSLPSLREISINEISSRDIEPLLSLFTRSSCTLDRLDVCGVDLSSRDYLDVLAHSSCKSLTSLSIRPLSLSCAPLDEEVLQRLTLHRDDTICSHLSFLTINYCIPTSLLSALLNTVESRIKCAAGQVPEEPELQYLRLHLKYLKKNAAKLDKVGRRSGMEYSHERFISGDGDGCLSVWFQRQGFRAPPNFDELFWV